MPETTFEEIIAKYVEMNIAHPFMEGQRPGHPDMARYDAEKANRRQVVDWRKGGQGAYTCRQWNVARLMIWNCARCCGGALTDRVNDREVIFKGIEQSYYYEGYEA